MNKLAKSTIALCTGLLIMAVFVIPKAHAQTGFSDVPQNHQFYQDIMLLKQAGVINGYQDGTFRPNAPVSRAAALKIIFGATELPEVGLAPFPDVPAAEWFAKYIAKAKELGIVKGNPNGLYEPGSGVNKAGFMKMLLAANGVDISKHQGLTAPVAADVPGDAWFAPYLSYSKAVGITTVGQDGRLNPSKQLSRGEVSAFMARLMRLDQGGDTQKQLSIAESKLIDAINAIRAKDIGKAETAAYEAVVAAGTAVQQQPDEPIVNAAATIAIAFQQLVASYKSGINQEFGQAIEFATDAKVKAIAAAGLFEGVKAISDQVVVFADQVISEANTQLGSASASVVQDPPAIGDTAQQIQAIQTRMQELSSQYDQLNQQLQQLQGGQTQPTQ